MSSSFAKTNLAFQARAHVILFSSDLALAYAPLVDYYSLRFQIEFNFRDAKQYWGLEDFMQVTPPGVTNAANLSLFMVNVAYRLQADGRQRASAYSVLDSVPTVAATNTRKRHALGKSRSRFYWNRFATRWPA